MSKKQKRYMITHALILCLWSALIGGSISKLIYQYLTLTEIIKTCVYLAAFIVELVMLIMFDKIISTDELNDNTTQEDKDEHKEQ